MEPARGGETARLRQLLGLVIEHHTAAGARPASPNASGEPATPAADGTNARMLGLAAFFAQPTSDEEIGSVDLLALRLLLDEYSAEVTRERDSARAAAQALERVRTTIREFRKVQKDFKIYLDAAGP